MGAIKCCASCVGCFVFTKLICIGVFATIIVAVVVFWQYYLKPWGESHISSVGVPSTPSIPGASTPSIPGAPSTSISCSKCAGPDLTWPTTTTGMKNFLDTAAGATSAGMVAASLAAGVATAGGSIWILSIVPTAATVLSSTTGFFEMIHVVEQAQFISLLGQLQTTGSPRFLLEFCKQLSWTNLNFPIGGTKESQTPPTSRRLLEASQASGVGRYAWYMGVSPEYLFIYTLITLIVVVCVIFLGFGIVLVTAQCLNLNMQEIKSKWAHRVIWLLLQLLILIQYILAMTSSYQIYISINNGASTLLMILAFAVILICSIGLICFGVWIIVNNKNELSDVGTELHEKRPFFAKYGPYYDDYNFENRFFFVPKMVLALLTGVVVGIIQSAVMQILIVLALYVVYLLFLVWREPYIIPFFFTIGMSSTFLKVILLILTLFQAQGDSFPQDLRNNMAYAIIAINVLIFLALLLRQLYVACICLSKWCKARGENNNFNELESPATHQVTKPTDDLRSPGAMNHYYTSPSQYPTAAHSNSHEQSSSVVSSIPTLSNENRRQQSLHAGRSQNRERRTEQSTRKLEATSGDILLTHYNKPTRTRSEESEEYYTF